MQLPARTTARVAVALLRAQALRLGFRAAVLAAIALPSALSQPAAAAAPEPATDASATTAGAVAAPPTATVRPGGLVRWPGGEGVVECGQDDRSWPPRADGTCIFPIDLLAGAGDRTVWRTRAGHRQERTVVVGDYPYAVQRITLEDDTHVHLSDEDLARVRRESAEIRALWRLEGPTHIDLPLHPPLDPLPEGGRFGARRIINGAPRNPHSGADYGATRGTPVLAAADGTAVLVDEHFFAGNSIFLDHGNGLISMYFHLDRMDVEMGEQVRRGQVIGAVGSSGRATGPHLHFGLRWHGARIDPVLLLGREGELPALR